MIMSGSKPIFSRSEGFVVNTAAESARAEAKRPKLILDQPEVAKIFALPPNRETLGGTAYFIQQGVENILIDCPAWNEENQAFLTTHGVRWLVITHRGGIGKKILALQAALQCQVVIQEQEAYLIPEVEALTFQQEYELTDRVRILWTPGHSPGSSCVYADLLGGVLFTGRHLLPDRQAHPAPLRTAKTFHWPRQLRAVAALRDRYTPDTLNHICPGASIGYLRGAATIDQAYYKLMQLDLTQIQNHRVIL
jgi:glyoxylase-like metal-dependent hydrolase (beta-lactamase superfamily II)